VALDELETLLARELQLQRLRAAEWRVHVRAVERARGARKRRGGPRALLARLLVGLAMRLDERAAAEEAPYLYT
jgi:hypothetical protein